MTSHQITAIRKPDRNSTHEHITHVKYDGRVQTREYVISLMRARTDSFYVRAGIDLAWVEIVNPGFPRAPYIKTVPDRTGKDNLLSLPEC
jgi:hypothetical protein